LRPKWAEALMFLLQVVLLSCALGIAIDLVTANVAVEYFTVHHPRVVESESPWVMALVWGVGASWWFGLIAAVPIWWANSRRREPLPRGRVVRMVAKAMALVWLLMMGVLVGVYALGGLVAVEERRPTFESDRRLMSVAMAHMGEYALGAALTIVLVVRVSRLRE
jgi:hypothetical protein